MSFYQKTIADHLSVMGRDDVEPRHVEALMRLTYGVLDGLSPERFRTEVVLSVVDLGEMGVEVAEDLARSYGL
jgi:hypothetical protein